MRAAVVIAVLCALATPAYADEEIQTRRLRFAEKGKHLVVSGAFTDVFDQQLLEDLSNGFATVVVLRAYVYQKGRDLPVATAAATFRVVYDLWDEIYEIRITEESGDRNLIRKTRADALKEITTLVDFPIARLDDIPFTTHHYLGLIVEVNPVSEELLAEVRRWISRPRGGQDVAASSSFFGSFVSIFVNPKVAEADRTLKLRSQYFYRPERK